MALSKDRKKEMIKELEGVFSKSKSAVLWDSKVSK
jgi:ribosomal protein L10